MVSPYVKRFLIIGISSIIFTLLSLSWVSLHGITQNHSGFTSLPVKTMANESERTPRSSLAMQTGKSQPTKNFQGVIVARKASDVKPKTTCEACNSTKEMSSKSRTKILFHPKSTKANLTLKQSGKALKINQSPKSKSLNKVPSKEQDNSSTPASSEETFNLTMYNSSQLYELTKDFKLNLPHLCSLQNSSDHGLKLLVLVFSAIPNDVPRIVIRKTWGGYAAKKGAKLAFLLGATTNKTLQEGIERESDAFGDIIQGEFIDHYYNLTFKTISMMKWVSSYCSNVNFVLKVDDDVLVNMPRLLDLVDEWKFNRTIIGKVAFRFRPHRNKNVKWYVPKSVFGLKIYPNYTLGPAYVFTTDAAEDLYQTSLNTTFLHIEDVFMTGLVAQKSNVRRIGYPGFYNHRIPKIKRCYHSVSLIASHQYSPKQIEASWSKLMKPVNCTEKDLMQCKRSLDMAKPLFLCK